MTAALATYPATAQVAGYTRISRDRNDGKGSGLGVARQAEDVHAYADRLGLPAPVMYSDNDRSGWSVDVVRPDFERLLEDVRAGHYAAVVAWHLDRFTRQPMQLELLWSACKSSGTELHTVLGGHVTSPMAMRFQGAISAEESDVKSARITRKHEELAMAGKFHGGKRRYGYTPDMSAVVDSEAAVIRDLAARILAGSTLATLARELRDAGVPTALGGTWTGPNLSVMLRRPHLAGLRTHKGELHPAAWEPILDRSTWERLQLVLSNPSRKTNHTGNARRYLLSGFATCYTCGAQLRGRPGTKANPTRRAYACATGRHCYRAVEDVDAVVEARVVRRLSRMTAAGVVRLDGNQDDELAALTTEAEALDARLEDAAALYAAGTLSAAMLATTATAVEAERAGVAERLTVAQERQGRPLAVLEGMTGASAQAAWDGADLGRRRAVLELLCTVQLRGAATKRAPFDPEDVVVTWAIG